MKALKSLIFLLFAILAITGCRKNELESIKEEKELEKIYGLVEEYNSRTKTTKYILIILLNMMIMIGLL